jgi:anti-sigma regulatory factor (Ser/Thr protein kinase)
VTPRRSFQARPASVAEARSFVRSAIPDLDGEVRDDITLMVSELCTNALVHGGGSFVVAVDFDDDKVRVTVTNQGAGHARLRDADHMEPTGRGLRIVRELSDDWGSSRSERGETIVWLQRSLGQPAN